MSVTINHPSFSTTYSTITPKSAKTVNWVFLTENLAQKTESEKKSDGMIQREFYALSENGVRSSIALANLEIENYPFFLKLDLSMLLD